ncbi:MAG: hypothetical protein R3B96_04615 [Pirellulaceae bacterium]
MHPPREAQAETRSTVVGVAEQRLHAPQVIRGRIAYRELAAWDAEMRDAALATRVGWCRSNAGTGLNPSLGKLIASGSEAG